MNNGKTQQNATKCQPFKGKKEEIHVVIVEECQ